MEQETKLVPPSAPVIEVKKTILTFEQSSIDFELLMHICCSLMDNKYRCTIKATGIYNQIGIVIEHLQND